MELKFEQDHERLRLYSGDTVTLVTRREVSASHEFVWRYNRFDSPAEREQAVADQSATCRLLRDLFEKMEVADFSVPFDGGHAQFRGLVTTLQFRNSVNQSGLMVEWRVLEDISSPGADQPENLLVNGHDTGLKLLA